MYDKHSCYLYISRTAGREEEEGGGGGRVEEERGWRRRGEEGEEGEEMKRYLHSELP